MAAKSCSQAYVAIFLISKIIQLFSYGSNNKLSCTDINSKAKLTQGSWSDQSIEEFIQKLLLLNGTQIWKVVFNIFTKQANDLLLLIHGCTCCGRSGSGAWGSSGSGSSCCGRC